MLGLADIWQTKSEGGMMPPSGDSGLTIEPCPCIASRWTAYTPKRSRKVYQAAPAAVKGMRNSRPPGKE